MAKKLYIGRSGNVAARSKKVYVGNASNRAKECRKIYVGDSNNKARLTYMRMPITLRLHGAKGDSIKFYYPTTGWQNVYFNSNSTYKDVTFDFYGPTDTIVFNSSLTGWQEEVTITWAAGTVEVYVRPKTAIFWYGYIKEENGEYFNFVGSAYGSICRVGQIADRYIMFGLTKYGDTTYYTHNISSAMQYIGSIPQGFQRKVLVTHKDFETQYLMDVRGGGAPQYFDAYTNPDFVEFVGEIKDIFFTPSSQETKQFGSGLRTSPYFTMEVLHTNDSVSDRKELIYISGIY